MRVLSVIPGLGRSGGAERSLAAALPEYARLGIECEVVVLSDRTELVPEIEATGARVIVLGESRRAAATVALTKHVRRHRPDLLHTALFDADVAGRCAGLLTRTPVVSSLVSVAYGPTQRGSGLRRHRIVAAQALDAATARIPVRFHALTEHVRQVMGRRLLIDTQRIDVIPRGRSPEALGRRTAARRATARSELGVAPDDLVVLAVARHEYQKGLDTLVESIASLAAAHPSLRLVVAGRYGSETATIRAAVDRHGLGERVELLGSRDDVPELMCAADVLAMSSRWEGFGGVMIEALALELPVVATAIGPAVEILGGTDPVGLLVAPDDPGAIAAGIEQSLADPTAAADRARRGRDRFLDRYTTAKVAVEMSEFFERAIAHGVRRGRRA